MFFFDILSILKKFLVSKIIKPNINSGVAVIVFKIFLLLISKYKILISFLSLFNFIFT